MSNKGIAMIGDWLARVVGFGSFSFFYSVATNRMVWEVGSIDCEYRDHTSRVNWSHNPALDNTWTMRHVT